MRKSIVIGALAAILYAGVVAGAVVGGNALSTPPPAKIVTKHESKTIYVVNRPGSGITNRTIKSDIPAWEKAANRLFSRTWDTPRVRIRLVRSIPQGAWGAVFQKKGSVQGALAYHTVVDGAPRIVVYSGVGDYYGFDNSVSFTHEEFELLADPTITRLEQGWPDPLVYIGRNNPQVLPDIVDWAAEVCDPVERYSYSIGNTRISDWITPNWFNDRVNVKGNSFDFLGKLQEPQTIAKDGYAQFFLDGTWYAILNFSKHSATRGFFLGESDGKHVRRFR